MLSPRASATLLACVLVFLTSVYPAAAAPGDLDPGFGNGGLVQTDTPLGNDDVRAVVIQPDGKIVGVGGAGSDAVLVRYGTDGVPDASFGIAGVVTTHDPLSGSSAAVSVALDAAGRIVTAGNLWVSVRRYLENGDPDASFGTAGTVQVPFVDGERPTAVAVGIQSDGRIVVAGHVPGPGPGPFPPNVVLVMRFDEHGVLDASYGGDGIVTVPVVPFGIVETTSLVVQADDKVVVGVAVSGIDGMLVRLTTDGQLDDSFNVRGMADAWFRIRALTSQPDGKLVAVGSRFAERSESPAVVVRFRPDGLYDPSFDGNGIFDFDPTHRNDDLVLPPLSGVGVQADGKIVVAGTGFQNFTVARLTPGGAPDPSYGHDGIATSASGTRHFMYTMALQDDGRAILAGTIDSTIALVRHLGSVCGDATQDTDEHCDDGNRVDGDGCDGNCTPTGYGTGVVTAGEQCDDGNTAAGDCCAASCQLEADGAPCDDLNQCTATSTCATGICTPGPTASCDDGDACTGDTCDPPTGLCRSQPLATLACHQLNVARENLEHAFSMRSSRFGSSDPDLLPPVVMLADTIAALSSAGDDTVIEVFDTATGARRAALPDPSHQDRALGPIAALGTDLLVVTRGGRLDPAEADRIDLYEGATFSLVRTFIDPTPETPGFGTTLLGHAGRVLARDPGSHVVGVFDATSGDHRHTLAAPGGDPHGAFGTVLVGFGDHQVLVGDAGAVHLYDLDSGALVRTFVDPTPGQGAFGSVIAVHADDVLVGGRHEGRVYAFDPTSGAVRGTFDDPSPQVNTRFGDVVTVAGTDVVVGRDAGRIHVFDATTRALRLTILDPLPSDGFCFGRAILPVFGDRLAIADPCFGGGSITGDTATGQVYLFDQATGALRTIVRNPNHDDQDGFTVVASWHDTLFTYFRGFSEGTIVAHRPCANGAPAFGARCLDGPCVDPAFCPGPCDFMFCGVCTRCDTASVSCIGAPRDRCATSSRPARTTLRLSKRGPRVDWQWKAGAALTPGALGDPTAGAGYGICLYEEDGTDTRLILNGRPYPSRSWRRAADGSFVFRDRTRESGIDRLVLQTGRAGRAGITARLAAPWTPLPTLPVTKRLRIQLQQESTDACWESVHDPADAGRNDRRDFRGRATQASP